MRCGAVIEGACPPPAEIDRAAMRLVDSVVDERVVVGDRFVFDDIGDDVVGWGNIEHVLSVPLIRTSCSFGRKFGLEVSVRFEASQQEVVTSIVSILLDANAKDGFVVAVSAISRHCTLYPPRYNSGQFRAS
jgi:hypothetical protein